MADEKNPLSDSQKMTNENAGLLGDTNREQKIMNSIINITIIMMSTMMSALAEAMTATTGAMATGLAGAFGDEDAKDKVSEEVSKMPKANDGIEKTISSVREDAYKQLEQKWSQIKLIISDPAFDLGPKIVEKYDFGLPKLTERLDDHTLSQYSKLLMNQDRNFVKMLEDLRGWLNSLPKIPGMDNQQ